MAEGQSRKNLEFRISNQTRHTLRFHRFDREFHRSPQLNPELPPGLPDCCQVYSAPDSPDIVLLVLYAAESFTLAIFVRLCPGSPKTLRLELSRDRAHLNDLDRTWQRMSKNRDPPDPDGTEVASLEFSGQDRVSLPLRAGPYKVTATVSRQKRGRLLRVQLERREMRVVRERNDACVIF